MMIAAGCTTELAAANLTNELAEEALIYSPFKRRRITLLRIMSMLGIDLTDFYIC